MNYSSVKDNLYPSSGSSKGNDTTQVNTPSTPIYSTPTPINNLSYFDIKPSDFSSSSGRGSGGSGGRGGKKGG